jgi:hypothetical protein
MPAGRLPVQLKTLPETLSEWASPGISRAKKKSKKMLDGKSASHTIDCIAAEIDCAT